MHRCEIVTIHTVILSTFPRYTFVDILRAILLSLESMIEDPELQVNGFILIIDWSNFTFKQASKLTPSMLRLAIEGLQVRRSAAGKRLPFLADCWFCVRL